MKSKLGLKLWNAKGGILVLLGLALSIAVSIGVSPHWYVQKTVYQVFEQHGSLFYLYKGKPVAVPQTIPIEKSSLSVQGGFDSQQQPPIKTQWVTEKISVISSSDDKQYALLQARVHYGIWSLLPALLAIFISIIVREPLIGLLNGIISGAIILGKFDIINEVLLPNIASDSVATVILLYLILLGGLIGLWSKTGAAQAFAQSMSKRFVRGPVSAKLVGWFLGVSFFQGGTISTVLVGTTVRPLADINKVSHEEMSYVVDSTASPIAILLPFNAWPVYVQSFLFVPGIPFLATESDRIAFFFKSIPLNFYALFAILGTLLLCLDYTKFSGAGLRKAMHRSRTEGALDRPGSKPLSVAINLHQTDTSSNQAYQASAAEFVVPLVLLLGVAIGSFIIWGSPKIYWAFTLALLATGGMAMVKGMKLETLMDGLGAGLKGVVVASVILILAITIGKVSNSVGAGQFLVDLLGNSLPHWALPGLLLLLTIGIAFSTGSSWGTYALVFPLSMPFAWAVGVSNQLENIEMYMLICFATTLNGSVFGDQCSPISDTTILSSMSTGADLMDHVKTQIVPASYAGILACVLWTLMSIFLV